MRTTIEISNETRAKLMALAAAMIENRLRSGGKVIGVPETLIAGICLARNLPLFTLNTEHFKRVTGLEVLTPASPSSSQV
ncbi:hypothetical protein MTAT_08070 [Moorella thermoacetica]|uniref:PIN domain-containing protein n=2 Tax=Neomoorella thermoacetica TaxID=1525 RepID=A0A1D7XB59_NEOTH|nr:type II toxin-antitoxin system VapC family toxin [Moorella thermoacetica]AOQ24166.1 hypothetical protein Maut_01729 [Moorella thermoacetica]OIQ07887.1 hypothetical protein MOOR_25040 [Moorella thermoacetica]OIQ11407.1 hypothetical protein MOOTH_16090 [Moorella thermoacetica]OIQ61411.1 hypothetical protein MTIN_14870 [Moorella thermoacetica]TYL14572.1 hypothetical protein MTAT_08070 [Moorella thermoacetica]